MQFSIILIIICTSVTAGYFIKSSPTSWVWSPKPRVPVIAFNDVKNMVKPVGVPRPRFPRLPSIPKFKKKQDNSEAERFWSKFGQHETSPFRVKNIIKAGAGALAGAGVSYGVDKLVEYAQQIVMNDASSDLEKNLGPFFNGTMDTLTKLTQDYMAGEEEEEGRERRNIYTTSAMCVLMIVATGLVYIKKIKC